MNRRPNTPSRARVPGSALLALGLTLLLASPAAPPPALAGIGNPIKKAKEKLAQKVAPPDEAETGEIGDDTVVFDDLVLELTDERIGGILAAFEASKAAGAGRPAAAARLDKAHDDRAKHLEKHGDAISAIQNKRGEIEVCHQEGYSQAQDRRTQEYAQKAMTDPGVRERFTKAAAEYNAAAARGDSTALQKLQQIAYAEAMATAEDSAAVRKSCGPIPAVTPAETRLAALDKEIAAAAEEVRAIDEKVSEAQAAGGGMERDQFAMATERIQMYLAWKRSTSKSASKPPLRGFTKEEIEAMEKRLAELQGALG